MKISFFDIVKKNNKFLILVVFVWLLISGLIGIYILKNIEDSEREMIKYSLSSVLNSTKKAYHYWFENRKKEIDTIVKLKKVKNLTKRLLEVQRAPAEIVASSNLTYFRELFEHILQKHSDLGAFIITPDRTSIASMRNIDIGNMNLIARQRPKLLDRVFAGDILLIPVIASEIPIVPSGNIGSKKTQTMFIAAPIENSTDEVIAVLALRLDIVKDFINIAQFGWGRKTMEAYIFDNKGIMISKSRFEQKLYKTRVLKLNEKSISNICLVDPGGNLLEGYRITKPFDQLPLTEMARSAISGNNGYNIQGYRDYRGVKVLGVWEWDNFLGFGIAAEIDASEALTPFFKSQNMLILIISICVMDLLFLALIWLIISIRQQAENQLQKKEKRLTAIFEATVDGIILIDHKGILLSTNNAADKIFGYTQGELKGKSISVLMPEYHGVRLSRYLVNYMAKNKNKRSGMSRELKGILKNGSIFDLSIAINEVKIGEDIIFTGIVRDITDQKKLNQQLINSTLEAESSNKIKTEFLSNISHEIRTPMNAILGMNYLLEETSLSSDQKELVTKIKLSSKALLKNFNNLLNYSKIESGSLKKNMNKFNLSSVLGKLINIYNEMSKQKRLQFSINAAGEIPSVLIGDSELLFQVLDKLTENAIKFTPAGGSVKINITIEWQKENSIKLLFSVKDTGIGISKDETPFLFKPLVQLNGSLSRKFGGIGLGLTLSKKIISLLGGELNFVSKKNEGSNFYFSLIFDDIKIENILGGRFDKEKIVSPDKVKSKREDLNLPEIDEVLTELKKFLLEFDIEALLIFPKLKNLLPELFKDQLNHFQMTLKRYDFEEANELLKKISSKVKEKGEKNHE